MDSIHHIVRYCIDTFYLESLHVKHVSVETLFIGYISIEFNTINYSVLHTSPLHLLTSVSVLDTSFYKYVIIFLPDTLIFYTLQTMLVLFTHFIQLQSYRLQYPLFSTNRLEFNLQIKILLHIFKVPYLQNFLECIT